ncbi:MAG: TetR/AcrR family transcriptional regulator [Deltaproteobacteria bacterium]|nr:TetR/AcrR family transcriptional regulator [Deltaproteobacteria bacterium]
MAYHHGDLRRALVKGALELLAEGGPAHLTLRGAARRAGVTPAAPYRHFADKRELLAAVAEEGFRALHEYAREAMQRGGGDAADRFVEHGLAYVRFAIEHPAHYRVMFGPEIPDKRIYEGLHAAAGACFEDLRESVRTCQAQGCLPQGEVELHAMRGWAMVHGLALLFIDGQLGATDESGREAFLRTTQAVLAYGAEGDRNAACRLPAAAKAPL